MTPSNFYHFPMNSILQKSECETVAQNIMRILQRKGNSWRKLSWDEYKTERLKDAEKDQFGFSEKEKGFFDQVIDYTVSAEKAMEFCKDWYLDVPNNTKGTVASLAKSAKQ